MGIDLLPFTYTKLGVMAMWFIVIIGFKLLWLEVWALSRFHKAAKTVTSMFYLRYLTSKILFVGFEFVF